ncbi:MAG: hypothetical protein R8M11_03565 [Gallionella sp.]
MKSIKLRQGLFFDSSVAFWRWLPDDVNKEYEVNIEGVNIKACVHLDYEGTSTGKIDKNSMNYWIDVMFLYLTVPVENAADSTLYSLSPPHRLRTFIAGVLKRYIATLHGIIRNDIGQRSIQNSHEIESWGDHAFLNTVEIMNPLGKWQQFCRGLVALHTPIPTADYCITQERWLEFKELIEQDYRCDLSLVFYRNAESHLRNGDLRLAIVEACIALERAISKYMPDFIPKNHNEKYLSALKGESLTEKVKLLLPLLKDETLIFDTTVGNCVRAVDIRNKVIHKSYVNLAGVDVSEGLDSIKAVLDRLNPRLFKVLKEKLGRMD